MKTSKIKAILIIFLIFVFVFIAVKENKYLFVPIEEKQSIEQIETNIQKERLSRNSLSEASIKSSTAVIFFHPTCHSCNKAKEYINKDLKNKYPTVKFEFHDITSSKELSLMKTYYRSYNLDLQQISTPTIFIGNDYLIGYDSDEKSGKNIEKLIENNFINKEIKKDLKNQNRNKSSSYIDTWFGKINIFKLSLPVVAIILGVVDGINPCAIWVLVYLIALVAGLNDKRKIWLIVGTFVLASGILYYLFMTALLNIFLFLGYLRVLQLVIGCLAFYIGFMDLTVYFKNKGQIFCKIDDAKSKQKTMTRAQKLVASELSLMTVLGVIGLAFVVNSIEFVCSSALPAIFTSVLAQAKLSMLQYYLYILLYVVFFMMDDMIIFGLAAFAINRFTGDRYIGPSKLVGGVILFVLGTMMIFFPEYLR